MQALSPNVSVLLAEKQEHTTLKIWEWAWEQGSICYSYNRLTICWIWTSLLQ